MKYNFLVYAEALFDVIDSNIHSEPNILLLYTLMYSNAKVMKYIISLKNPEIIVNFIYVTFKIM